MIVPSIPLSLTFVETRRAFESIRTPLNALIGAASLILSHPVYKFRLNITAGHLWVEVAKRTTVPGQEIWTGYVDFGALPT